MFFFSLLQLDPKDKDLFILLPKVIFTSVALNSLSFSLIFVYLGVVNEHWYITKKLQKYYAFYVFLGAILNIILNIYLIPIYGIIGAAYATIITYIFLIFVFDLVATKTRNILVIKLKSIIKL